MKRTPSNSINIRKKIVIGNEILPYTVWDEMAETDILIEYMRKYMDSGMSIDSKLKKSIFESLYSYSTEPIFEVEQYFAEKYYNSLTIFLERIKPCRNQEQ